MYHKVPSLVIFFLTYINDLSYDLVSTVKLIADDTSLFSVVHDSNMLAYQLNNDAQKISDWVHNWKISFNPHLKKQAQEVMFSRKVNNSSHPRVSFNNTPVFCANW